MTDLKTVYSSIPPHYETVNRIITLGLDRFWRHHFVKMATAHQRPGLWLDMCTGTGETALLLNSNLQKHSTVLAADYSMDMVKQFRQKNDAHTIPVSLADATGLPFKSNSFALITTSFATRNLNISPEHFKQALSEFYRVLQPGGAYISIETTRPGNIIIDAVFRTFVKLTVEPAGQIISGTTRGYTYLSRSIRSFYKPENLATIMRQNGFDTIQWKRLFPGAVAVHTAVKSSKQKSN